MNKKMKMKGVGEFKSKLKKFTSFLGFLSELKAEEGRIFSAVMKD